MSEFKEIAPNRLRRNSLGLMAVTFMVISAAAPLTGVAGAMPLAFLLGNGSRPAAVPTSALRRRKRSVRKPRDDPPPSHARPRQFELHLIQMDDSFQ